MKLLWIYYWTSYSNTDLSKNKIYDIYLAVVSMAIYFTLYIFSLLFWKGLLVSNYLPWASNLVTATCPGLG